jgi:tetratricopeptide (TPR) repeat protein
MIRFFKRKNPDQILQLGDAARDQRDWTNAAAQYALYLKLKRNSGSIWVQLGNCLKEARRYAEADVAYGNALRLMPLDADLHMQLGHLAKLDDRNSDAIAYYRRAAELAPEQEEAFDELRNLGQIVSRLPNVLVNPSRDRAANQAEAADHPEEVSRSASAIAAFCESLPVSARTKKTDIIPQLLHFVFGFKEKGDIPYYGYMAIKSALHFNPGWKAYYYSMHRPVGPIWSRIEKHVTFIPVRDFNYFGSARLDHYAHKADVIRMLVLNRLGGAYLDMDTITRRSFEDLRKSSFVMGVQAAGPSSASGMANAIMMGQPDATFSSRWLQEYDYFRSRGRDDLWDYHSVKLPVKLASEFPEDITVLGYRAFFYPLWISIERAVFSETSGQFESDFEAAYCFHLWNGDTGPWLEKIDDTFTRTSKSLYAKIAREVEGVAKPGSRQKKALVVKAKRKISRSVIAHAGTNKPDKKKSKVKRQHA